MTWLCVANFFNKVRLGYCMLSVILTELGIGVFDNDKCVKSFPFSEPAEDYVFVKKGKSRLSDLSKFLIDEQKDVVVNDLALNDLLKKKDIEMVPFTITKGKNGDAYVKAINEEYSPAQISAFILQKMKDVLTFQRLLNL